MDALECLTLAQGKVPSVDPAWAMAALGKGLAQHMPIGRHSAVMGVLLEDGRAVIYAAAGRLDELLAALPELENFYRSAGASSLWVFGRKGWRAFLERRGWRHEGDGMVRDLHDG